MSLSTLVWFLTVFWSALYYARARTRKQQRTPILPGVVGRSYDFEFARFNLHGRTLSITLRNFHLKFETNGTNGAHQRLTEVLSKDNQNFGLRKAATVLYNVGVVVGVFGMLVGIVLLAVNACNIIWRLLLNVPLDMAVAAMDQFSKRSVETSSSVRASSASFVMYAIIPGVTVPWSHLPLIILALFVAQVVHEAGHFVSAALDAFTLDSIGFALTLFIPSAFVALSPTSVDNDSSARLRVVAAGAWHNLTTWIVLYFLTVSGVKGLWTLVGYDDISLRGIAVTGIESDSPLAYHLASADIITMLDDMPLVRHNETGGEDLWSQYLLTPKEEQVPLEQGWCVKEDWFYGRPNECCRPNGHTPLPPVAQVSCFIPSKPTPTFSNSSFKNGRCIDPVPLLVDTSDRTTKRCRVVADCDRDEIECIRPDVDAQLLRVTVETTRTGSAIERRASKVVLWSGPRTEVWEQVSVGDIIPRWRYLPTWLPSLVSLFFSYFSMLSLSLFFFNLLVLPALDGSEFFSVLLLYMTEHPGDVDEMSLQNLDIEAHNVEGSRASSQPANKSTLRRWLWPDFKRFLKLRKGRIERVVRYLTIGLCVVSLIGMLVPS